MMKRFFGGFLIALVLLSGCRDVKESAEYRMVVMDRDSLAEALENRENEVAEFAHEFEKIETNLSAIDTNKSRILELSSAGLSGRRDRIHGLIADIYIALDQNQATIRKLEQKIKDGSGTQKLEGILRSMQKTLKAKEAEIVWLEKELSNLKLEVKNLKDAVVFKEAELNQKDTLLAQQDEKLKKQAELLAQKEAELNKVYYIRGTTSELEKAGIIRKEGGVIGLGSVKVLGSKLGGDRMRTLNAKTDLMLLIGRFKKKKVISNHPSDSYFFIAKDGQFYIKISYPDKFWSLSRYLVVAAD